MRARRQRWIGPFAVVLLSAGCGSDAQPSEAAAVETTAPTTSPGTPLTEIPRDQLYGASAAANLWSPKVELEVVDLPAGWDGARIAFLSDFHIGAWEENDTVAAAAVRRAVESRADIIVLLGDYVDTSADLPRLRDLLAPLGGRRVVAVLGDQDVRADTLESRVVSALQSAGINVLRNSTASFVIGGDTASIAGLDAGLLRMPSGDQNYILSTLGQPGPTPLLITHIPGFAARAPAGRFPVIVAGNTFCGEVEVPGTPRMSWVRDELFPGGEVEGTGRLFRVRGQTVMITCGLGFGFVPVRFGAAPEVPILTLRRFGAPAQPALTAGEAVGDSLIRRFQREPGDTT